MIPLRRALIVKEHKTLTYPEGTACAEVLIAGEKGGLQAKLLFQAFGLAFLYKFLMAGLKLWKEVATKSFGFFSGGTIVGRGVARAAGGGLHHRAADRRATSSPAAPSRTSCWCRRSSSSAHGLSRAALPGDDAHQGHERRARCGPTTSSTSARARWPRRASSRCSARCRPSSARSGPASRTSVGTHGYRDHPPAHRPRPADLGHDRRARSPWRCCSPCCRRSA